MYTLAIVAQQTSEGILVAALLGVATLGSGVLAILGQLGKLPRNGVFGLRTRKSMSSDAAWRSIHARFTPFAWLMFVIFAATALIPLLMSPLAEAAPFIVIGLAIALVTLIGGSIWAHRRVN
ncbi:SdpI family protein [Nonomuraea rubra]|uniref:SdpI family protein n=1 Tax=Nonomuraea rubra TaxID=46180 RepID=UPI0033C204F4